MTSWDRQGLRPVWTLSLVRHLKKKKKKTHSSSLNNDVGTKTKAKAKTLKNANEAQHLDTITSVKTGDELKKLDYPQRRAQSRHRAD